MREYPPGKVQNIDIYLDGKPLSPIFGVAQYPEVSCPSSNGSSPSPTQSTDCQVPRKPPLLLFTKPSFPLSEGKHTLKVIGDNGGDDSWDGNFGTITFSVLSDYKDVPQQVPEIKDAKDISTLFLTDNCAPGYYYDSSAVKIPLPRFDNKALVYQYAVPKTPNAKESEGAIVQIGFEGYRYDVFFPDFFTFYGKGKNSYMDSFEELFLPKSNLYY